MVAAGVRVDAGAVNARAHSRPQIPLLGVRQVVLTAVAAAGAPALAHRRKAVRLRALRQGVRRPVQPARSHADALGVQAVLVQALRQVLRAQGLPQQAPRVVVRPRRRRLGARRSDAVRRRHSLQHDQHLERVTVDIRTYSGVRSGGGGWRQWNNCPWKSDQKLRSLFQEVT